MFPLIPARAPGQALLRRRTQIPLHPRPLARLLVRGAPGVVGVGNRAPGLGAAGGVAGVVFHAAVGPGSLAAAAVGCGGAVLGVGVVGERGALLVLRFGALIPRATVELKPLPRSCRRVAPMLSVAPSLTVGVRCGSTAIVPLPLVEPPVLTQAPALALLRFNTPIKKLRGPRALLLDRPQAPDVLVHRAIRDDTIADVVAAAAPLVHPVVRPLPLTPAIPQSWRGVRRGIIRHLRTIGVLDLLLRAEIPVALMLVLRQARPEAVLPRHHVTPLASTLRRLLAAVEHLALVPPVVEAGASLYRRLRGRTLVPCLVRLAAHRAVPSARSGVRNRAPRGPPGLGGALIVLQPVVGPVTHAVTSILGLGHHGNRGLVPHLLTALLIRPDLRALLPVAPGPLPGLLRPRAVPLVKVAPLLVGRVGCVRAALVGLTFVAPPVPAVASCVARLRLLALIKPLILRIPGQPDSSLALRALHHRAQCVVLILPAGPQIGVDVLLGVLLGQLQAAADAGQVRPVPQLPLAAALAAVLGESGVGHGAAVQELPAGGEQGLPVAPLLRLRAEIPVTPLVEVREPRSSAILPIHNVAPWAVPRGRGLATTPYFAVVAPVVEA
mmetsp:Transcript_10311/g.26199  ORF Transcript_10311/g.26199 Transcript_10311/m.26199 type:complete len:610 (+) Transcript_10311:3238-5067(+)